MTCEVIKKEGIAHLPPLSFRSHHVSVPPQLCLRRAGLYAAFQLDVLRRWQYCLLARRCLRASLSSRSATGSLKQPGEDAALCLLMLLMLVPNYCRKPPLPLCSIKDRSQGHISNLNVLCPH